MKKIYYSKSILSPNTNLKKIIENLAKTQLQICFICKKKRLIGTVTDGDIRRALLKGIKLDDNIKNIMNKKFFFLENNTSFEKAKKLMSIYKINQIPVLNKKGDLIDVFFSETINVEKIFDNPIIIMAGGFGKRLYPITKNCPKPLLPIGGKPVLEHIIKKIRNEGFKNIIISTHYLGEMIFEYFGDGSKFGVNIKYIDEVKPLGTAGCISKFKNETKKPFLVCNGDVITDISFEQILTHHLDHKADATMAVRKYILQNPFGVIKTKGNKIINIVEKPVAETYVNAGIYAFNPIIKKHISSNKKTEMPQLFRHLKKKKLKTIVFPMHEDWLDIGNPKEYEKAQTKISKKA